MTARIGTERDGGILRLEFANPPVNALSIGSGLVDALIEAIGGAIADERVEAIVLCGASGRFSAGADIKDFAGAPERLERIRHLMDLVEGSSKSIVAAMGTSPEVLHSAMVFAKAIGKTGVVSGVCDGLMGNRIFEEYLRQAWFLLEEGALPQQLDTALEAFGLVYLDGYGFPAIRGGPMFHADTVGLGTLLASVREVHRRTAWLGLAACAVADRTGGPRRPVRRLER